MTRRGLWALATMMALTNMPVHAQHTYDVVVVGGTPGGIMAAIAVARNGCSAVILDRNAHIGGLPANGLGATDIATRGATGGLFADFVGRVRKHYVDKYGADSQQVRDCSDGYRFEPHVGALVFDQMLAEHKDRITVLRRRQFDADPQMVKLQDGGLTQITVTNLDSRQPEAYSGRVFIDATYEGDLAAAAGAEFRIGREAQTEFDEPMAGKLYKQWAGPIGPGSTGLGDNAVQAYNYRLCLTRDPENLLPIEKPAAYNRDEYISLVDDVKLNRIPAPTGDPRPAIAWDGIGRVTNMVALPYAKTDANNQHVAFLSTDLPGENWPWPTAGWDWRDRFAGRLRDYTLGLLWFAQNDPDLPEDFRARCREWGLAKNEYTDNGGFPRQVYVREGRRIVGEHLFTARDALPISPGARPPVYADSITASHYALDSHAVLKREPGRAHLDGFFSKPSAPYTVPYGVIVPRKVENLLTPVPVSGTHVGFSTLRMEPCWMALGEAAGTAAAISVRDSVSPRKVDIRKLQENLLDHGAVLVFFRDASPGDEHYVSLQMLAVRGLFSEDWTAKLNEKIDEQTAAGWVAMSGVGAPAAYKPDVTTRGELLDMLYDRLR